MAEHNLFECRIYAVYTLYLIYIIGTENNLTISGKSVIFLSKSNLFQHYISLCVWSIHFPIFSFIKRKLFWHNSLHV